MDKDVEGSGAPRKIDGIESRKVLVIDIDKITRARPTIDICSNNKGDTDINKIATKLV